MLTGPAQITMAQDDILIIDDRSSGSYSTNSGGEWRLITDRVMGGVTDGRLSIDVVENRSCLRLRGDVKLDNNGGFLQAALDISPVILQDIENYKGLALAVYGNGESYNIHLRTDDNRLPWQSYRARFTAAAQWNTVEIPFTAFTPHRTETALDVRGLKRIGIVAIGREFGADICYANLALYR